MAQNENAQQISFETELYLIKENAVTSNTTNSALKHAHEAVLFRPSLKPSEVYSWLQEF